jgi:hypothetical protein
VHFDAQHLRDELHDLHEVFWSVRLVEWIVIAGAVGALRRAPRLGAFLLVWFVAYMVVKGSANVASMSDLSYFRLVSPGIPAYVLLGASTVFLVPGTRRRTPAAVPLRPHRAVPWLVAFLLGVLPLVLVATARAPHASRIALDTQSANAPISSALTATMERHDGSVTLSWRPLAGSTRVSYVVYRAKAGDGCQNPPAGVRYCILDASQVTVTDATSTTIGAGGGTYRIAAAANSTKTLSAGDLMLLGPPVTVP